MGRWSLQGVGSVVTDRVPWVGSQWSFVVGHDGGVRNQETSWGMWRRRRRIWLSRGEGDDLGCGTRQGMSSGMGVKMHSLRLGSLFTRDCSSTGGPLGIFSCVS